MADGASVTNAVVEDGEQKTPVSVVTAQIESGYDLASLFQLVAMGLHGVPEKELFLSRTMPIPNTATMTIAGNPLPGVWYNSTFGGEAGTAQWVRLDPASVFNHSFAYSPYTDATIDGAWGWVKPVGAPSVQGWNLTVTMVMDPDTTLLRTIIQHRKLVQAVAVAGRKSLRYVTPPGVLHNQALSDHVAPYKPGQ